MIFSIIGFACLAHLAADFFEQFDQLWNKPFKCNMCMGFWLSLPAFIVMDGVAAPLLAAITGITSEIIYRLINRL